MSVHGKVQALVREWLILYVGEQNAGPLSRWPADRWAVAFNETGFFLASVMYTEAESGAWDVSFELPIFKPRPTTTDRHYPGRIPPGQRPLVVDTTPGRGPFHRCQSSRCPSHLGLR